MKPVTDVNLFFRYEIIGRGDGEQIVGIQCSDDQAHLFPWISNRPALYPLCGEKVGQMFPAHGEAPLCPQCTSMGRQWASGKMSLPKNSLLTASPDIDKNGANVAMVPCVDSLLHAFFLENGAPIEKPLCQSTAKKTPALLEVSPSSKNEKPCLVCANILLTTWVEDPKNPATLS